MMLCLDIGNSRIKAAVFDQACLVARFDEESRPLESSEFLQALLTEQLGRRSILPTAIKAVSVCQVLGGIDGAIDGAIKTDCRQLFQQDPFLLNGRTQVSLTLHYHEPERLGPDRISAAIGASARWPGENLIVIDCGTAISFCCIDRRRHHLGGVIAAGPGLMARALASGTARLPSIQLATQPPVLGRCTESGMASGLFYGSLGLMREITGRLRSECFPDQAVRVIATGGHAPLFASSGLFDAVDPDLVLYGLLQAHPTNS